MDIQDQKANMWYPFKNGLPIKEGMVNSWTCIVSPEVYRFLKSTGLVSDYVMLKNPPFHDIKKIQVVDE